MDFDPVLMAAVLGLVNFLKEFGVTGRWATVASMVIGILASFAQAYLDPGVFAQVLGGITFALAASGLYDLGKGASSAIKSRS